MGSKVAVEPFGRGPLLPQKDVKTRTNYAIFREIASERTDFFCIWLRITIRFWLTMEFTLVIDGSIDLMND